MASACNARGAGLGRNRGRRGGFGRGHDAWGSQVASVGVRAPPVGRAQGGREEGYEIRGCFVISETPGTELKTKIFSRLLDSNEKLFNIKFVQFFKIYNFCFRHFFI